MPAMRRYFTTICLLAVIAAGTMQAQTLSVSLSASEYNGYNISCFGLKDGSIDATVTGGTPPYTYDWSNRATTEDLADVPAGYYKLTVMDADSSIAVADITLTEPTAMKVVADPYRYPNRHNISCHDCFNGSIDVTVYHGVPPYSYMWNDSATTEDRSGLGALKYVVVVTDANGCQTKSETVYMTQPERESWDMGGNSGTDPATHFIGTTDSAGLVFKSNGLGLLRLTSDGTVKLLGAGQGAGLLYRLPDGTLRGGGLPVYPPLPPSLCYTSLESRPYWETRGNDFSELCEGADQPRLGTLNPMPLSLITSAHERMVITTDGKVGIGAAEPGAKLHVYGDLLVQGEGWHGEMVTSSSASTGPVIWARNYVGALGLSIDPDGNGRILKHWGNPTTMMTFKNDEVSIPNRLVIGDVEPKNGYQLFVQDGILTEKVKVALKTSSEWSDHVFNPSYRLMPLTDVAKFIREHGHLPGVPSADQMVEQGLDVVRTDAMLLEKIEEIMLHLIRMEERVAELEKENGELRQLVGKH